MKLDAMSVITGRVKNRSLLIRIFPSSAFSLLFFDFLFDFDIQVSLALHTSID